MTPPPFTHRKISWHGKSLPPEERLTVVTEIDECLNGVSQIPWKNLRKHLGDEASKTLKQGFICKGLWGITTATYYNWKNLKMNEGAMTDHRTDQKNRIPVNKLSDAENKKFQYNAVSKNARSREYNGCIEWLIDAGVAMACHCLHFPELPLKGNEDMSRFKLYYPDTGLLVAALDDEAQEDLRTNRNMGVYKGALYENFVAEAFVKQGLGLFYYKKENSTLEEDFFVRTQNELIPVEVKSSDKRSKSLATLIRSEHYGDIHHGIKLGDFNIGKAEGIITFPYFCSFMIREFLKSWK